RITNGAGAFPDGSPFVLTFRKTHWWTPDWRELKTRRNSKSRLAAEPYFRTLQAKLEKLNEKQKGRLTLKKNICFAETGSKFVGEQLRARGHDPLSRGADEAFGRALLATFQQELT
ncbi:unnamed protein product, partial [Amoebophrya sp. A25]